MTGFDERERAIEAQFEHEQALDFFVAARANRLLARWASRQLRLPTQDAADYETSVVRTALENGGEQAVIDRLTKDLDAAGLMFAKAQLRRMRAQTMADARAQILAEGLPPGEGSPSH
ncbi:DUF1476 domain-containing protein [Novosphingobium sp. BL-52-GroH]|uniref:DUF1476 domain-containing protein n=1 Tax=Novosphingobium sp. BL-52-GroH TaxID=3349877 RepID=UPI00384B225D